METFYINATASEADPTKFFAAQDRQNDYIDLVDSKIRTEVLSGQILLTVDVVSPTPEALRAQD